MGLAFEYRHIYPMGSKKGYNRGRRGVELRSMVYSFVTYSTINVSDNNQQFVCFAILIPATRLASEYIELQMEVSQLLISPMHSLFYRTYTCFVTAVDRLCNLVKHYISDPRNVCLYVSLCLHTYTHSPVNTYTYTVSYSRFYTRRVIILHFSEIKLCIQDRMKLKGI